MELRQLKYFVEVAEQLHYGKAAEQLFISQPAISQQIKNLEENMGVELFDANIRKNYRKVKLTPAGEYFYKEAQKLLQQAQSLKENTQRIASENKTVRLGVYKALLKERIVEYLADFRQSNPLAEVSISEYENYHEVQTAIANREIDKGLTLLPISQDAIRYEILKKGSLSLIMSKQHPKAFQKIDIEQVLRTEKWIELSPKFHPVYKAIEEQCHKLGFQRQIVQEVSSLNLLISLVSLNNGIAFAPSLFDFSTEPNVVAKSLENTVFKDIEICHVVASL
jgi:DNA-binding transcriptional LysR family regulator